MWWRCGWRYNLLQNNSQIQILKKTFEDVFGKDSEQIKEEITELIRRNVIRIVIEKMEK